MTSRISEASSARPRTRATRAALAGLSSMALTAAIFAFPAGQSAQAAPALTVAEAKAQIEQLTTDAAAIDQDYAGVKEQVDQGKAKLSQKQADLKAQGAEVAKMKSQVGQVALAQFQNRDIDTTAKLFVTDDTEDFLSQVSTVEQVSENQNTVLQNFQAEQSELAELEHSNETDLAALQAKETELRKLREASDKKVAESKAVLARLNAAEQKAIAEEAKKAADEAKRTAEGRSSSSSSSSSTSSSSSPTTDAPAAKGTGRGATALAFAKKQLGKPYSFGATGPSSYDCSGLTGAAWRAAGVSLSRTSQSQIRDGRAVAKSDLQPGDLVFFYSSTSPSHVGLYAGNGMLLHAPRPGKSVEYIKMSYMPFSGARRPG